LKQSLIDYLEKKIDQHFIVMDYFNHLVAVRSMVRVWALQACIFGEFWDPEIF
jgi:hypothetical protein